MLTRARISVWWLSQLDPLALGGDDFSASLQLGGRVVQWCYGATLPQSPSCFGFPGLKFVAGNLNH